jgi:enoyl-[acyl-carrier protein] reductase III
MKGRGAAYRTAPGRRLARATAGGAARHLRRQRGRQRRFGKIACSARRCGAPPSFIFRRYLHVTSPLAGRTALITGGARGIGRATAKKLAAAGADIIVNYYNSHDEAQTLVTEIEAMGRRALAVQSSVADVGSVDELVAAIRERFEHLDIVVSNAASGVLKPALEMTLKHWRWCMETNAFALNLLAQRAAPMMGAGGCIIGMTSLGSERAIPNYAFIGASKAALEALVRSLAQELGPRGIRVNAVSAGVVDTDALAQFPNREELLREYAARTPAGPLLTPANVADAIYLLCLPEAGMITGQTITVDGGFSISG